MDNLLVLQKTSNQLEIKNLEKPNENTIISLGNAIENFTISHREDSLAIFTVDQIWHFYKITTAKEVENSSPVPYKYFDIVFILQNCLWVACFRDNRFEFNAFRITGSSPDIEKTVEIKELQKEANLKIIKHFLNNESLFCVLAKDHHDDECWVIYLKYVEDKFETVYVKKLDYKVSLIQPSFDNSFVAILTVNNEILILDQGNIFKWKSSKSDEKIRSICFDPNFMKIVCIESREWLHFFYYISKDNNFVQISKTPAKSTEFVIVAIRIPNIYTMNEVSYLKNESFAELEYLKVNQALIDEMFDLEYSEFIRQLHQKSIGQDRKLWTMLAKRCLKHDDIESSLFCAAKMNDARLIRSVRSQQSKLTTDVLVIVLYLNFNLLDEAEELLTERSQESSECKALLAKLYSLENRWEELFRISDAMQLKTHYYVYARKLEEDGDIDDAIKYYELSGNQLEVPRMLFESGNILHLEEYSLKERDSSTQLVTWWGQYCESQGDNHRALDAYRKVNDYYNLVRLLCQDQRVHEAIILVDEQLNRSSLSFEQKLDADNVKSSQVFDVSGDASEKNNMIPAILYLGKHLEATDPTESIRYYLHCKAIRHALRVCIIRRLYDQLAAIAVEHCTRNEAENILQTHILPNRYELESEDSLVPLLYKCDRKDEAFQSGIIARAWAELRALCDAELSLEVGERVRLNNDVVQSISSALRDDTSLIDIFIDIVILSEPDNFTLILSTIQHYGLVLDDHLMDKLERVMAGANTHSTLVETFAELCLEKGNYQLAAKLFNKSGKRLDAMKALIRSGNAEKVIQFANIARDKQIYTMAGNFLQTIGHDDRTLIERFYIKAGANEQLDRFRASSNSQDY